MLSRGFDWFVEVGMAVCGFSLLGFWVCCLVCYLVWGLGLMWMLVNSVGLLFFVLLVLDFGWIVCYCLICVD